MTVQHISAITLAVRDMSRSVGFYRKVGFALLYGGEDASFTSFRVGDGYLNLILSPSTTVGWWGRAIFRVGDVDGLYAKIRDQGLEPEAAPRDAEWGERFFHVTDPDGHELSFAQLLG